MATATCAADASRITIVAPTTGRGAQLGSGGFRSTGQTGPAVADPRMPVSGAALLVAEEPEQAPTARPTRSDAASARTNGSVVMAPGRSASDDGSLRAATRRSTTVAGLRDCVAAASSRTVETRW